MATTELKGPVTKTGRASEMPQCADCSYARVFADEPLALCLRPGRPKGRKVVYAGSPPCEGAAL